MKNFAFFCIPAHGHTNPMIPVARELVSRGHWVRFYSFEEFREKIEGAGAEFVPCDRFLPALDEAQETRLKRVSTTEMSLTDLGATANMDGFLAEEMAAFRPDLIYSDSVCFWGKLTAQKYGIPIVVSTSTFAFNQLSSQYQKQSFREIMDLMLGMPKVNRALKKLEPLGYHVKGILSLVQSDNKTDSVVYTSRAFQPYSQTFSDHYAFVGPSLAGLPQPDKKKERPLVYISMGTVINERPDLYRSCIKALEHENVDVLISCGRSLDPASLGPLPANVQIRDYVDQPEVLRRADVFLTHCGMNSVSESLYMAVPMVLYPQTGEQEAVARRAAETGAGVYLKKDTPDGIRAAIRRLLDDPAYAAAAEKVSRDLRSAGGPAAAADFLEAAPHPACPDPLLELNKKTGLWQLLYWTAAILLFILWGKTLGWSFVWIPGILANPINKAFTKVLNGWALKKL